MPSGKEQEGVSTSKRRAIGVFVCAFAALLGLYVLLWSFLQDLGEFRPLSLYLRGCGILVVVLALAVYCTLQKPRRPFFLAGLLGAGGGAVAGA